MRDYWEAKFEEWGEALRQPFTWVKLGAAIAVVGTILFLAARLGSGGGSVSTPTALTPEELQRQAGLMAEAEALENKIKAAESSDAPDAVQLALLDQAIVKRRQLQGIDPRRGAGGALRLARLEVSRDTLRARAILAELEPLERAAEADRAAGRFEAATQKLRTALQLRLKVNGSAAASSLKDFTQESRLSLALEAAEAEPTHRLAQAQLALAQEALAAQRWADALVAFAKARTAQLALNREHPHSLYADIQAVDRIDEEIATLRGATLAADSAAQEKAGDAAVSAGRMAEAAADFARGCDMQKEVNAKFARSRYADEDRVADLETKRQTALSAESMEAAHALDRAAAALLRAGETEAAAEKISAAVGLTDQAAHDFPASRRLDPALKTKLVYLGLRRADLRAVQEQVAAGLLPVPGGGGVMMLATEITQELYTKIMNHNPSRNAGRALPVDSVSWRDACECCERLSWLLGRQVRLPRTDEFRAALGAGQPAAWTAATADGRSHEAGRLAPNAHGFYDLLGNLAEWLEPEREEGAATAPLAGGSYLDAAAPAEPVRMEKTERGRQCGFRFVVEPAAR